MERDADGHQNMVFAYNCYIFAESKGQIFGDPIEELKKKGLDWKEDQMELISWGLGEKVGDLHVEDGGGQKYVIREVDALKAMGAHMQLREERAVMQSCIHHSSESWSWNKEMVDALHGCEIRNLDLMSSRRWASRGMSLEWFRANQIRKARQRYVEGG